MVSPRVDKSSLLVGRGSTFHQRIPRDGIRSPPMNPERWQRLEELFHRVLELPPEARAARLAEAGGDDLDLRAEVNRLLHSHAEATSFVRDAAAGVEHVAATIMPEAAHIGAYRIVRELGRGGMGTVYLGERADAQFEMRVAVKLIKRGMDTDAVLQRFRHERQILAGLEHPTIARLLDGGTTDEGLPYFVMEYVDGQPIDEYCRTHQLSLEQRLRLFLRVCEAVQYAHQGLVVHRDLKPSNILVTAAGEPKLLDFGIAKLLRPQVGEESEDQTASVVRLLTPDFASPEQVRGDRVTTASDVYALGVVLYEVLSGRRPYRLKGGTAAQLERAILERDVEAPSTALARDLRRQLRGDLDNVVLKALRKDPAERYATAAELADDVRRYLDGFPVRAAPDRPAYRIAKFLRRHHAAVTAGAAGVFGLVAGLGGS